MSLPMQSESLSIWLLGINSASNGIGGGTVCNFIFFGIEYNYIDQSAVCVAYSFHMINDYATHQLPVYSIGTYRTMGPLKSGAYEMIITFEAP